MGNAIVQSATITLKDQGGGVFGSVAVTLSGGDAALGWSAPGLSQGDTMTIITDGTFDFTAKAIAAPMYYWDSKDNSLDSSSLSRRSFTLQNGVMDGVAAGNSPQSARYNFIDDLPSLGAFEGPFDTSLDNADQDGAVMFASRRFNFSAAEANATNTSWNMKLWRWWSAVGSNNTVLALGQTPNVGGNPRITNEKTTGSNNVDSNVGLLKDVWSRDFITYNYNSTDIALDGVVSWNGNGYDTELINCSLYDVSFPNKLKLFYWPQQQQITGGWGDTAWRMYAGHFYFDDSRHAVVISDNATWGQSNEHVIEVQIPTAWVDNSITVSLRQGLLSSMSGKYLYILDNTGVPVSTSGVLI